MKNYNLPKMKYTVMLLVLLLGQTSCKSQEKSLLLEKTLLSDISNTPIYPRLTQSKDGVTTWKEQYKYLDSIEMYSITYLSDGLKVKGLMVKPKKTGKYPCIIYNRGGNREFGSLKIAHAAMWLGELAKEGYVTIASQYRGNAGGEGQEEFGGKDVNDVTNLISVLEEIEDADTQNIGMYGWSRGGMMTYIALTQTDRIKAAVTGGAVSNCFESTADRPSMEEQVYAELVPNYVENREEEITKRSAIKWVDKFPKNVPILLLHGTSDWRVKPSQSLQLATEFDKYRIPYRLIIFEGGDHGITEHRGEVNDQVMDWFDRFLKNNESLPNMEYHGR